MSNQRSRCGLAEFGEELINTIGPGAVGTRGVFGHDLIRSGQAFVEKVFAQTLRNFFDPLFPGLEF